MFHFYAPWKYQKTSSFLTFSGGIEIELFNKERVMTKEDNEGFENSAKFWTCDIDNDVKVRDHCHITG